MVKGRAIRFGAIGCGGAGTHRIRQLANHPMDVDVVAAVDIDPTRLDNLETVLDKKLVRYDTEDGYRRMIDELELDAVGVFTPHTLHYDHAKHALEKGKHLLIEKPMVCGTGPSVEIAKLAEANDVVAVLHYQRHYEPQFIKGRELIRKGVIGEVESFFVYMAQDWRGRTWRGDPKYSGGGQINDSGSHYQDILLWMTDQLPKRACGHVDHYYHGEERPIEINGSFNVELANGAGGRIIIIGDVIGGFTDDVRICGDKGMLIFYGSEVWFKPNKGEAKSFTAARPKGYPESPCDNFVKLIRGKARINRVPLIYGARVAMLTDAMLTSAQTAQPVECRDLLEQAGYSLDDLAVD